MGIEQESTVSKPNHSIHKKHWISDQLKKTFQKYKNKPGDSILFLNLSLCGWESLPLSETSLQN